MRLGRFKMADDNVPLVFMGKSQAEEIMLITWLWTYSDLAGRRIGGEGGI